MKRALSVIPILMSIALFMTVSGTAFAGKIQRQLTAESVLEQVLKRGVLRVGMSTFVPWAMKDKFGKFIGFEIDVAKRLAKDMGVKVEFVPTKWDGMIPAVLTGKFDVIIGGMGIRPDRNLKVNFTIPYEHSGMSIVAHKKLAEGFTGLESFNRSDVQIACRIGTTAVVAAKKFIPRAKLRLFDEEATAYQELLNGNVHAFISSAPLPAFLAWEYPDTLFLPLKEPFTEEPIGFAIRKGDIDTLNYLDNWIRWVKAEGWLKERMHYWFQTKTWEAMVK